MKKRVLIVGGVAGGASAAARLRRNSEEYEIVMFEKGPHVSFSNCALPYRLSGTIQSANRLVLMSPEKFKSQYNIEARVSSEVLSIDKYNKEVKVKNLLTGEIYKEKYDKLILSPGARPIIPNIPGIENVNVFTIRNVVDIDNLNKFIQKLQADVRERAEFENGHIKGAINIPLSELRERVNEIPKDKTVYLNCRTGQRSYNAVLALQHLGFNNVVNITGSFLGLSFYEAYNDKLKNRESILTNYNFK